MVLTLIASASQILRDLNRANDVAVSKILTDIFNEASSGKAGAFWQEFNENTANHLKHADKMQTFDNYEKLSADLVGGISFCVGEYMALNVPLSRYMIVFGEHLVRERKRGDSTLFRDLRTGFDKRLCGVSLGIGAVWASLWLRALFAILRLAGRPVDWPTEYWDGRERR